MNRSLNEALAAVRGLLTEATVPPDMQSALDNFLDALTAASDAWFHHASAQGVSFGGRTTPPTYSWKIASAKRARLIRHLDATGSADGPMMDVDLQTGDMADSRGQKVYGNVKNTAAAVAAYLKRHRMGKV